MQSMAIWFAMEWIVMVKVACDGVTYMGVASEWLAHESSCVQLPYWCSFHVDSLFILLMGALAWHALNEKPTAFQLHIWWHQQFSTEWYYKIMLGQRRGVHLADGWRWRWWGVCPCLMIEGNEGNVQCCWWADCGSGLSIWAADSFHYSWHLDEYVW